MEEESNENHLDYKLELYPYVLVKKLDPLQYLDVLSSECLEDLEGDLRDKVLLSAKSEKPVETKSNDIVEDEDDDIQVIEVKTSPVKKKVEIKRNPLVAQAKGSRKKSLLSREIFKPPAEREISKNTTGVGVPKKIRTESIVQIQDAVSEKIAALKEKERLLLSQIRSEKKKVVDPIVEKELEAMANTYETPVEDLQPSRKKKYLFNQDEPAAVNSINTDIFKSFRKKKYTDPLPSKEEESEIPSVFPTVKSSEKIVKTKEKKPNFNIEDHATLKLLKTPGKSAEEKYRILEARDKLYQSRRDVSSHKNNGLVGTCADMCPEKERLRRCYQNQLSPFEMIIYEGKSEVREEWMVKEYARSSADQDTPLPHDLRPVPVLQRTMAHLCKNISDRCEDTDELIDDWYMFMWDRTRAIRKDLTHQDACSPAAVNLIEQCARFHIHCAERLVDQDLSVYDDKINSENLTKCLQTLKYLYKDLRSLGVPSPREPEFMGYSILLNLNNPAIMTEIRSMPSEVMLSEPIKFALDVLSARETKNYTVFFRLVKNTTYLNSCILLRYFSEMRARAFSTMVRAFCPQRLSTVAIPILPLVDMLLFESINDCVTHLMLCNLKSEQRADGSYWVNLNRKSFQLPEMPFPILRSYMYIQPKKMAPTSEIIWGGPIEESFLAPQPLQNSFNPFGMFNMETLNKDLSEMDNKEQVEENFVEPVQNWGPSGDHYQEAAEDGDNEFHDSYEEGGWDDEENESSVETADSIFQAPPTKLFSSFDRSEIQPQKPSQGFSFGSVFKSEPTNLFTKSKVLASSTGFTFAGKPLSESKTLQENLFSLPKLGANSSDFKSSTNSKAAPVPGWGLQQNTQSKQPSFLIKGSKEETNEKTLTQQPINNQDEMEDELLKRRLQEQKEKEDKVREEELKKKLQKEAEEKERLRLLKLEEEKKKLKAEEENKQRILAEKRRQAEIARKSKIEKQLGILKQKFKRWKTLEFGRKWRRKTWATNEGRKVDKYKKEMAAKYPPVCNVDLLDGNPYGIVIPNVLLLGKTFGKGPTQIVAKPRNVMSGPPPILPLVHLGRACAPALYKRVQELYPDPTSPFRWSFPWKLVLCLPDETETSVRLDTFLEMHFVERFDWKFGEEVGPLASCVHKISNLELVLSLRRVKGLNCLEGNKPNPDALLGANSFIFFLTDEIRTLDIAKKRLEIIRQTPGCAEVPVVAFVFGDRLSESVVRSALKLNSSAKVLTCGGSNQQSLVTTLSESLCLAAAASNPVPPTRSASLSSLLRTPLWDTIWRCVELALVNFDVQLIKPNPLITYYNQCLDDLAAHLLDQKTENLPRLAPEFESLISRLERPLEIKPFPERNVEYRAKLKEVFNALKLPMWPEKRLKSTQVLNYVLHVYGHNVLGRDKVGQKLLKWRIYRIIEKSLLWKGLDIYCDDDIRVVLRKFPWVSVMQEFALSRSQRVFSSLPDITVFYYQEDIRSICYESPLLADVGRWADIPEPFDEEDSAPMPENDSILLAYAKAIEREIEAEETRNIRKPSQAEEVADVMEKTLPLLNDPEEKEELETSHEDTNSLKRGFNDLDEKINELFNGLEKRRRILDELVAEFQS